LPPSLAVYSFPVYRQNKRRAGHRACCVDGGMDSASACRALARVHACTVPAALANSARLGAFAAGVAGAGGATAALRILLRLPARCGEYLLLCGAASCCGALWFYLTRYVGSLPLASRSAVCLCWLSIRWRFCYPTLFSSSPQLKPRTLVGLSRSSLPAVPVASLHSIAAASRYPGFEHFNADHLRG